LRIWLDLLRVSRVSTALLDMAVMVMLAASGVFDLVQTQPRNIHQE
jgi:hypothetical protein